MFNVRFQVYTTKSLYVGETSGETFDRLSDVAEDTIGSEIKSSEQPAETTPRISSLFNFEKLNLLPLRITMESSEDDMNNEIDNGDVIEIRVPVIGSEYMTRHHDTTREDDKTEIDVLTTSTTFDLSRPKTERLTFANDFRAVPSRTTTYQNRFETTTQTYFETLPTRDAVNTKYEFDDIQSVESKLMEQWKAAEEMDDSFESELFTVKSHVYPKYPFNVKIVVNNDDTKKSCKSKKSCNQVNVARFNRRDIDPQFYSDDSDEDLFFQSRPERYYDMANELRSRSARRAQDDMNPFLPITPAPRAPPFPAFTPFPGLKVPNFIEQLQKESSVERSERVNNNIDGLMKFISVWAQVDKFLGDRARTAIQKIAYVAGDDYEDVPLQSRRRNVKNVKKNVLDDEPFT